MALPSDPLRIVDRQSLRPGGINVRRVARQVRQDLLDLRRRQQDRLNTAFQDLDERRRRAIYGDRKRPPALDMPEVEDTETIAGYVSNVQAWLFNESRRAKETVVDLTGGGITRAAFRRWASGYSANRNTFDLSLLSHARAVQRQTIWAYAEQNELEHLAMIVPPSLEESVAPQGILARFVGRMLSPAEWIREAERLARHRQSLSLVMSLGLHHGDVHQMLPIHPLEAEAARSVLAEYRRRFLRRRRT